MANFTLPAHYRTWQFQKGITVVAQATVALTNARGLRFIKDAMTGTGAWTDAAGAGTTSTGNWTVESSSDGVGGFGNNDQVDRWAADANVVWANAGTNHSWIVLKQTGITGTYYLCIDCCVAGDTTRFDWVWSRNQFTGGTATARPTSTAEVVHSTYPLAAARNWGGPSTNVGSTIHVMKSADGKATFVVICRNNFSCGFWWFSELEFAPPADLYPAAGQIYGDSTAAPASSVMVVANFGNGGNTIPVAQRNGAYPTFGRDRLVYTSTTNIVSTPTVANDINGDFPIFRMGCYGPWNVSIAGTTPNEYTRGDLGVVRDLWWCQATGITEGDLAPSGGGRTHVTFGDFVLPNDTLAVGGVPAGANIDLYEVPFTPYHAIVDQKLQHNLTDLPELATVSGARSGVTYYLMVADDSVTGTQYTWSAVGAADWAGAGYPGPNSPVGIAIAGKRGG